MNGAAMDDLSMQVNLSCPTCGCTEFKFEILEQEQDYPDDWPFTCAHCGGTFTRAELIESNQESINIAVEEMGDEMVKALSQELERAFTKQGWNVR